MKTLTQTTAGELKQGDTFRRVKFRTEIIYTVTNARENQNGHILATKEGLHWPDPISKKEDVIFLKHKK